MALQESLNRFKQQQEKCQSTLKSISRANASSSNAKVAQQPPQKKSHTAASSSLTAKPAAPIKFSNDTERLQHINTIRKSSHGRRMKLVIDLLFETREALTAEEIYNGCYVDIHDNNNEIYDSLRNNLKVSFDGKRFSYKAKHDLKGKDDLLRLIRNNLEGLPVVDVKDSYTSVIDDLMALKNENLVWLLSNMDSQEDIVYPNDPKALLKTDDDVKQLFRGTDLPRDFVDLEKELVKMGMKPATKTAERRAAAQVLGVPLSKPKPKKRSEKFNRRSKLTNAHMPELFQFND
ncbi:Transcription initiation factor IIE subunit beta [Rhynchospora pubera]|uniref:Transcription initiation factor IIE subunit beta n=1 Tax=Rhynchospora pubera TaxID=906938 RepID=A0AAV8HGU8_9POAL|nr:Transcription initiation factor IIE subunit beta [Rhynchospora pubera]